MRFLVLICVALASVSCNSKRFDCSDIQKGKWAIQIVIDQAEDGSCPYEGHVVFEGEEEELVCEASGDDCVCSAGSDFGTYDVTITNTREETTDFAILKVEPAPPATCHVLDVVEPFEPISGAGGAGGSGGAR